MTLIKNTFSLLFFSCCCLNLLAQTDPFFADSTKHSVRVTGDFSLRSTAFPLEMSDRFINGGEITSAMKENGLALHGTSNYLGAEALAQINYLSPIQNIFGIKNAFWGIHLGSTALSYNQYSKDLYQLVFFGNAPYAGQELNLSNTILSSTWFHSLGVSGGWVQRNVGVFKNIHFRFTPAFVYGVRNSRFELKQGSLLTEENGEYINMDFTGSYHATDSLYQAFSPGGFGAKLDLNVLFELPKSKLEVSISDFGIVAWDHKRNHKLNSSFSFVGVEIEDVFNLQDSLFEIAEFQDSILGNSTENLNAFLPMAAAIYFEHTFSEHWKLKNWAKYRLVNNYFPFLMSQLNYGFNNFTAGFSMSYGGYASIQAGLVLGYQNKHFKITTGTTNVLGFIDQKKQFSKNIFGQLSYLF